MAIIDFQKELNFDQFSAVTSPYDRPALVLAGAGSGKTRTLTYRVAWLMQECGLKPYEILLLTFTNKAASEMLNRLESLTGFDSRGFWGGTFHSIGNRFLRIEGSVIGLEPNFTILDTDDCDKLMKKAVEDNFKGFFANKDNPRSKLLRDIISFARNSRISINSAMMYRFNWLETPPTQIQEIAQAYDALKRDCNACDFDDLLELWLKILKEYPEVLNKYANRFKNILVDEYQDTNKLQSDILDLLAQRGNLSAVGDDAQCIYSWRGAEIDNILCFKERYPAAFIYKIETNYRSSRQILQFANQILDQMPVEDEDYKKILMPARDGICKPKLIVAMDSVSQGRKIASMIMDIDMNGRYSYDDVAVLYRSHFQAMELQLQLQHSRVPFVITSGIKFFDQAHIKDIIAQVKFVSNPKDKMSFLRFCKFLPKIGDKTAFKILDKMMEVSAVKSLPIWSIMSDKKVLSKVPSVSRDLFAVLAEDINKLGIAVNAHKAKISEPKDVSEADLLFPVQGDLFADFEESNKDSSADNENVVEIASKPKDIIKLAITGWYVSAMKTVYEDWQDRTQDFDSLLEYASKFENFDDFIASVSLEIDDAHKDEDSSGGRVRLMTVHQAKGLEFPVVFVIGTADGLFPSKRSLESGEVDEERRLFYVASTRAMDYLVLSYPRVTMVNGNYEMHKASQFLEDIDTSYYDCET